MNTQAREVLTATWWLITNSHLLGQSPTFIKWRKKNRALQTMALPTNHKHVYTHELILTHQSVRLHLAGSSQNYLLGPSVLWLHTAQAPWNHKHFPSVPMAALLQQVTGSSMHGGSSFTSQAAMSTFMTCVSELCPRAERQAMLDKAKVVTLLVTQETKFAYIFKKFPASRKEFKGSKWKIWMGMVGGRGVIRSTSDPRLVLHWHSYEVYHDIPLNSFKYEPGVGHKSKVLTGIITCDNHFHLTKV